MEKAKMSAENQKMREKCEKSAKSDPTWPPNQKKYPLDGIRETLSLLRKERQTHCNLRKPIQVSLIRLNH